MSSQTFPNLELEKSLADAGARFVLGIDEVGRGSLAGPVAVGIAVVDFKDAKILEPWPSKLKDSKLIAARVRDELVEPVKTWLVNASVGYATAAEIDSLGITKCLALAAHRAFANLPEELKHELLQHPTTALLDGSHNWLGDLGSIRVIVKTKADRDCVSVAAASVLAKVERDNLMIELANAEPRFDWASNKGYSSPSHLAALRELGPVSEHRKTWLTKILGENTLFNF